MKDWIEVKATFDDAPEDWSVVADAFSAAGCPSTQTTNRPPAMVGYLADTAETAELVGELQTRLRDLGATDVAVDRVPEQDWSELWKIHFKPWRIGRRFVVRPTWEEFDAQPEDLVLVLDPGQAFGTGDHPTTRMCLELLEDAVGPDTSRLLDLGCGTGILAMAAKRLGVGHVDATDIDPIAVEITKENAGLNGLNVEAWTASGFDDPRLNTTWDVVVSNIISATLIRLAPEAAARVPQGGLWIVSGIIRDNWPLVLQAASQSGFVLEGHKAEGDWVAAVFRKA